VVETLELVVDELLQEVSNEAEIRDATSTRLKHKNIILFFTVFSPYFFS
jgi:hypothetical protein